MNNNKIRLADAMVAINHMTHIYEAIGRIYKNGGLTIVARETIVISMHDLHTQLLEIVNECMMTETIFPAFFTNDWGKEQEEDLWNTK